MILKSLRLENFRTYRGPEQIDFAHGDKNVTIIQGNNEVGKTTIMNNITWCLYHAEYYKNEGKEPILSKSTCYDMDIGDEANVKVTILMEDSRGRDIRFIRSTEFFKNDLGDCTMGESSFDILIDDMVVSEKGTYIAKHLPEKIREYFLFDGEQLEKYFRDDNKDIKVAVKKLSQLNLLERISRHISKREDDYVDKLKQLNPALGRVLKKEKFLKESLESKESLLKETTENLDRWEIMISNLEDELMNYGEDPNKLIALRKQSANDLKKKEKDIIDLESKYNEFLLENLPKILSISSLLEVKGICNYLEEKGYIPARFKKEFLEYLLESHECICGADLSEGTDAYNKMKQLYEETDETTNIADTVNILLGSVNSIISNFPKNL